MALQVQINPEQIVVEVVDFGEFVDTYGSLLSRDGVLVQTDDGSLPKGHEVDVIFQLEDGFRVVEGRGLVAWSRSSRGGRLAGVGLHFLSLAEESGEMIDRMVQSLVEEGGEPFSVDREAPTPQETVLAAPTTAEAKPETAGAASPRPDSTEPESPLPESLLRVDPRDLDDQGLAPGLEGKGAGSSPEFAPGMGKAEEMQGELRPEMPGSVASLLTSSPAATAGSLEEEGPGQRVVRDGVDSPVDVPQSASEPAEAPEPDSTSATMSEGPASEGGSEDAAGERRAGVSIGDLLDYDPDTPVDHDQSPVGEGPPATEASTVERVPFEVGDLGDEEPSDEVLEDQYEEKAGLADSGDLSDSNSPMNPMPVKAPPVSPPPDDRSAAETTQRSGPLADVEPVLPDIDADVEPERRASRRSPGLLPLFFLLVTLAGILLVGRKVFSEEWALLRADLLGQDSTLVPRISLADGSQLDASSGRSLSQLGGDDQSLPRVEILTDAAATPATLVENVRWQRTTEATLVELQGNGALSSEAVSYFRVGEDGRPREVVQVAGIVRPYFDSTLRLHTPEVDRLRFGYHLGDSASSNELWVVFDLTGDHVRLTEIVARENWLRLRLEPMESAPP